MNGLRGCRAWAFEIWQHESIAHTLSLPLRLVTRRRFQFQSHKHKETNQTTNKETNRPTNKHKETNQEQAKKHLNITKPSEQWTTWNLNDWNRITWHLKSQICSNKHTNMSRPAVATMQIQTPNMQEVCVVLCPKPQASLLKSCHTSNLHTQLHAVQWMWNLQL